MAQELIDLHFTEYDTNGKKVGGFSIGALCVPRIGEQVDSYGHRGQVTGIIHNYDTNTVEIYLVRLY